MLRVRLEIIKSNILVSKMKKLSTKEIKWYDHVLIADPKQGSD